MLPQVPLKPEDRPRYTKDQLNAYFHMINLPPTHLKSPILSNPSLATSTQHALPLLKALVLHHLTTVPFENLSLHYSPRKTLSLDMHDLYAKIVGRNGHRGGYCMENNGLFGTVLRSLGFRVRNCAARVSRMMSPSEHVRAQQGQTYDGWNHMLNLVLLDGEWWVVDVGMGNMGPCAVYKLQDGVELESIAPRRIRLQKRAIAESYSAEEEGGGAVPKLWCFDVCYKPEVAEGEERAWIPTYAFTEAEFLPQDFEMMNYFTSTNKACLFTYVLIITKMLADEAGEKIVGDITMLNDTVRRNFGSDRKVLRECKTEKERVDALRDFFGVELTEEDSESITPELKIQ
ncbi:N-hydroxyarylamine O-acetyltransferase [Neohortaea acidophila]|uniref:N-hydroxyarylamine O-acetyltransferase n=1 Tax=Neohortaea acidophila TaxID=245834 RepID=A0A6A6PFE1_9PEZI|nr:N-hydroxyarylamine O-acetyltransferase [Neohortaea acidophila]KAF2478672.1 N-hydroxyarylamine O-acetyltransferase [Neohortaea acidophila]